MSFRDKAREIREHGAKQRGQYSPSAGSVPVRLYKFWAETRSHKVPVRENFCHYWRVVLIWAPLWYLVDRLHWLGEVVISNRWLQTVVLVAGLIGLGSLGFSALYTLAQFILGAYVLISASVGFTAGLSQGAEREDDRFRVYIGDRAMNWMFPSWIVYGAVRLLVRAFGAIPKRVYEPIINHGFKVFIALGVAVLTFMLGSLAVTNFVVFVGVLIIIALFAGTIVVITFVSDYFTMQRLKAEEAERLARKARIHDMIYNPNYNWDEYHRQVRAEVDSDDSKSRPRGSVETFFTTIGDFFNLIFQAVRVKKWKICPIVEIPRD